MIKIKSSQEISLMLEGGQKLALIRQQLMDEAKPGKSLLSLDKLAQKLVIESGGTPSFKTVPNYHWTTCLCINEVVVHGIPSDYILRPGDVLTVDVGMLYKGFHTDTAETKIIEGAPQDDPEKQKFLNAGEKALRQAIKSAKVGNRIGNISQAIQEVIESEHYNVVATLVGHGVGTALHEEPQIPGLLRVKIENTPILAEGMTLAIEVIYAARSAAVVYTNDDGWSISTRDGSLSAVFEHTIALSAKGPLVLTQKSI